MRSLNSTVRSADSAFCPHCRSAGAIEWGICQVCLTEYPNGLRDGLDELAGSLELDEPRATVRLGTA